MNYKLHDQNPIEMLRMAEKLSQADFAVKLGFPNKAQYTYHMKQFTTVIIDRIEEIFGYSLTMPIINHLKCYCRRLNQENKSLREKINPAKVNDSTAQKSIVDMIEQF